MKMQSYHQVFKSFGSALLCGLLLTAPGAAQAASGTWTNAVDAPDNFWSVGTNWLDNIVADGAGSTATFGNELAAAVTVSLDTSRTIGNLDFLLGAYTITNNGVDANILMLAGPAKPFVNVPVGTAATIRRTVLGGAQGFVLDGGGQLNLFKENSDSNNVITGGIVLSNGTIQIQGITDAGNDNNANTLALLGAGDITFYNGTLNIQPAPNTSPEYGVVSNNFIVPSGANGTIILPVRVSGASGDNTAGAGQGIGGALTGSGTFNVRSRYVRGNVVGDWSAFTGLLDIGPSSANGDNAFRFGNPAGYPSARVNFSGASPLSVFYYRQLTSNTNIRMGVLSGDNAQTFLNGSASVGFTLFYDVGALHTNASDSATFAGTIGNAAGPAGLIKRGAGTLILTGPNTYTGSTTISNGVLQIGDGVSTTAGIGAGPITNRSVLVFAPASDTNITVTARITGAGSLTNVGPGQLTLAGTNNYSGPTYGTGGKLIVGTASAVTGRYLISDGAGFGALVSVPGGRLMVSNLTFGTGCSFDFDLSSFGTPANAVVTNGTVILGGDVAVNVSGSQLTTGTVTLLTYTNRTGAGAFMLGNLPPTVVGAFLTDDLANKRLTLTMTNIVIPPDTTLRYVGDANGIWDIDNLANQIWVEAFSSLVTNYYDGAQVRFDDSATGTNFISVATTVSPASIVVSNTVKDYTFGGGGSIGGTTGVRKQGSGQLTLLTPADSYVGAVDIQAGTLAVGDGVNAGSIGTGPIVNDGTLRLNSPTSVTVPGVISGSGSVVADQNSIATLSAANAFTGGLTVKTGAVLTLANATAAGGTGNAITIEEGTITLNADISGTPGYSILVVSNAKFTATANRVVSAPIRGTNVTITFDKTALITLNADISNVYGIITNVNTGGLRFNSGGGNNCIGTTNALFVLEPGSFLQNRNGGNIYLGGVIGTGTIGSPQNANNSLVNFIIGGLNTSTAFEGIINDNNTNANNRLTGFTKAGTGTLSMTNATLSYFGPTLISNGVLRLAGTSLPNNSTNITVVSPGILDVTALDAGALRLGESVQFVPRIQSLRGNGSILGNVVLTQLGRLEPGFAPGATGTLTGSGTVTLGGTNVMELTTTGGAASDRLIAANINYSGGTLILTNLGNITGSNVFQLFSGGISGTFANIITQNLSGVTWDLSQLNVNGSVRLIGPAGVNTTPTNITATVAGNQLDLQWPADHTGWELQTNAVSVADANSWFVYPPSLTTNRVVLTIDPTKPNVYYRLRYQLAP